MRKPISSSGCPSTNSTNQTPARREIESIGMHSFQGTMCSCFKSHWFGGLPLFPYMGRSNYYREARIPSNILLFTHIHAYSVQCINLPANQTMFLIDDLHYREIGLVALGG